MAKELPPFLSVVILKVWIPFVDLLKPFFLHVFSLTYKTHTDTNYPTLLHAAQKKEIPFLGEPLLSLFRCPLKALLNPFIVPVKAL